MTVFNQLTDRSVKSAKTGEYCDGQGLWLHVSESGAKKWVLRFSLGRRVHELGLGSAHDVPLAEAREKAREARRLARSGVDPIAARREGRKLVAPKPTFGQCAGELIASKKSAWRSEKHAGQWETTLRTYCAALFDTPIDTVDTAAVLGVLRPLWQTIPETASRLRARIEAVLGYAAAHGWRTGDNPAAWGNRLEFILPGRPRVEKRHHAALPHRDVPAFLGELCGNDTVAARALHFLILTAARSGEVLGACWSEIDIEGKIWTVPATRMKAGRIHRVPLSGRAVEILGKLAETRRSELLFPSRRGRQLPDGSFRGLMPPGMTAHGFRSSFRDWAAEVIHADKSIAEACLAHRAGSPTELAYFRSDILERRRALLEAWSQFCTGTPADNIRQLRA